MEVVALILERSVVVGLALDGDRTKRCSNGEVHDAILSVVSFVKHPHSSRPEKRSGPAIYSKQPLKFFHLAVSAIGCSP